MREKTLRASLTAANGVRDGLLAFDAKRQQDIVESATSLDDGKAKLTAYRDKRDTLVNALLVTYAALALAALDKSLPLPTVLRTVDELRSAAARFKEAP